MSRDLTQFGAETIIWLTTLVSFLAMEVSAHSLFLLQQLNVQREFGFLCDCTVAIGNVYFKAHRAVLAAFSNYFKMIFIHQSSECIKIQPADIQPDVFSYLLHVMYTGSCPKQAVEQTRLEDGIKFLHAHQLCCKNGEGATDAAADTVRMSNLYGIQISSQLGPKEAPPLSKTIVGEGGLRSGLSMAVGLEGVQSEGQGSSLRDVRSVASGDDCDVTTAIKQERRDDEGGDAGRGTWSPVHDGNLGQSAAFKEQSPVLTCPRCGQRCSSPEGLREHLFSHALDPALFTEGLSHGTELRASGENAERLDAGCLEEALRQSRALATQLAAELRRSRAGADVGLTGPAPSATHSRKRKITCAVCGVRFSHKSQLQEHMYAHTAKPTRHHRHSRLCGQLFHSSTHFCEGSVEPGTEGGASAGAPPEEANREAQDNGSSCYSLDSEISQESADVGQGE
ncbi:zinc finger and BTB domain-containing protein 25 isoform X2 [Nerophis ophidion]|uniref:zinc finger and BTB domain-containing protein 25 isoform X2 n=1 Tax=Nerophis ophidion TaxID=159077 RepID=UPI002AE0AC49|nr:zinc finger and BTB domain-containing protein 25 isoform X2 [Nerophis ophidion]